MKRPERRKEKACPVSRGGGAAQEPFEQAPGCAPRAARSRREIGPAPRLRPPLCPPPQHLCRSAGPGNKPDEPLLASPTTVTPTPLDAEVSPSETGPVLFSPAAPRHTAGTLTAPGGRAPQGVTKSPAARHGRAEAGERAGFPPPPGLRTAPLHLQRPVPSQPRNQSGTHRATRAPDASPGAV